MQSTIKIHEQDNVAVALRDLAAGETVELAGVAFPLAQPVARGHKFALGPIAEGEDIIKYGQPIGHALVAIGPGEHIHSQNAKTNLSDLDSYRYQPQFPALPPQAADREVHRRAGGGVGSATNCGSCRPSAASTASPARSSSAFAANAGGGIDGVHLFSHPFGCSQLGQDHANTRIMLQNMARHPNAGAVLVIGLGCENNQVDAFRATLGMADERRLRFMVCQQQDDEVEAGLALLHELYREMRHDRREPGRLSELKFGLECGGSDGLSGITANPLLGRFSDYVIANGGTTVLTEVPEMFGAERILMSRCRDGETFDKTVDMINDFKRYFIAHQQPIYENPSPGNKAGGITTLEEKSLGCTQKRA